MSDNNGRILILVVELEGHQILLINIYNANTETEQFQALTTLLTLLDLNNNKQLIFSGGFNLIYNKLEALDGNPKIKKVCFPLTISYHLYFLRIAKVWSKLHPVSVG